MDESFRVLQADDESAVVAAVKIALKSLDCSFESAPDGQVALDRITADPDRFDLLITDDYMPGLGGLELVRQLRAMKFSGKIFVLSAYLSPEMKEAYAALNVDRMIDKPFDVRELRSAVEDVAVSRRNSLTELPARKLGTLKQIRNA